MNFLKLLPLFGLFNQILSFIKDAEATFKGPSTGAQKLQHVIDNLTPIVQRLADSGIVPSKLTDAILVGLPAIVSLIVQIMNFTGGVAGAQPAPSTPPATVPTDPTAARYNTFDEAKAHLDTTYVTVLLYHSTSNYGVWPSIGPYPADSTAVWPE